MKNFPVKTLNEFFFFVSSAVLDSGALRSPSFRTGFFKMGRRNAVKLTLLVALSKA